MRLLFITNVFPNPLQPTKGVFNLELARALKRDNEVSVICPVAWTDECAALRRGQRLAGQRTRTLDGIPVRHPRFYFPPKMLREYYGQFMWHSVKGMVLEEIDRIKPDVILSYWAHPDGEVAVRAARQTGLPAVVMVGGSDVLLLTASRRRQRCILRVLHTANAVVAVSGHIREKLIELGIPASKLHIVSRGVDPAIFCPGNRDEARRRLGIATQGPVLLWVGRMVPVKGLDILMRSCGHLHRAGREFALFVVGDGPLRASIERQAREQGVSDLVQFPGVVKHSELADWYRAADLTILPSRSEGIPNVLRESLACGTPFVATNVGGISELVGNGDNRLVPSEDWTALAGAMEDLLARAANRKAVPQTIGGWDASADALIQVLRSASDQSRGVLISRPAEESWQFASF